MMENSMELTKMATELEKLLLEINNTFEPSEDEDLNALFYSELYKANGFCSTLKYILERSKQ